MVEHDPDSALATPDELLSSEPGTPGQDASSEASTPLDPPSANSDALSGIPFASAASSTLASESARRVPSLRTVSDPQNTHMGTSSVSGALNSARRPPASAGSLPQDLMARARALQEQRMGRGMGSRPSLSTQSSGSIPVQGSPMGGPASPLGGMAGMGRNMGGALPGGLPGNLRLPPNMARPVAPAFQSAPTVPNAASAARKPLSLSERRAMKLGSLPGGSPSPAVTPKLSELNEGADSKKSSINGEGRGSKLSDFGKYIDTEKGWITFEGAATITRTGVNFANGATFSISLDEIEVLDELGKGNYGTVYKVRHGKSKVPRFGQGLSAFRKSKAASEDSSPLSASSQDASPASAPGRATSGVVMAMKELRLELDESKFTTILKELLILHECRSPYIIDFYGAFFQEGAVYMCLEYMDGGSIDKLYAGGIPESVLRKITYSTIMGLKTLKEEHNIIHRDVKPTNILANTNGQVKICDFGVSGNLVASIAKTNIGCQSYMAPERISGGGMSAAGAAGGTYSVQSDIWSLGLTIIECSMGRYPYPPEVSSTIFSQLSAIVEGDPPDLPPEGYSATARDFVRSCLNKVPAKRHTYPMLLAHPWMKPLQRPETITEDAEAEDAASEDELADATGNLDLDGSAPTGFSPEGDVEIATWVRTVLDRKKQGVSGALPTRPALHTAPLDSVSPAVSPAVR